MATVNSNYHIDSASQRTSFPKSTQKWLLRREQLEEISRVLSRVIPTFNDHVIPKELPDLQDYCFKSIFEMCEQGRWFVLRRIGSVIQGLTDSSGNTVLSQYIQQDTYIPVIPKKETTTPNENKTEAEQANKISREREQIKLRLQRQDICPPRCYEKPNGSDPDSCSI